MAYSSLKRKTPLKAKVGFKARQPLKRKPQAQHAASDGRGRHVGGKRPKAAGSTSKSSLETHLDIVFSLYIRLRDAMDGGKTQCISCGRIFPFEQMQCGHYHSRKNMATRWDEDNCHAECAIDNCSNQNHLDGYTANLIAKIGQERFDELNVRAHGTRKWHGDELREMIRHYTSEARRISREKGIAVRI